MPTQPEVITDTERIRALAHPLRLQLLDHLRTVDEATATECAEATGDSVASCSFHLRMLAKYGYIEPAARRGREKPWRIVHATQDLRPDRDQPESVAALEQVAVIGIIHETERARHFFSNLHQVDRKWYSSSTLTLSDFWVTPEELAELSRDLQALALKYSDRDNDPSLRPKGSQRARLFGALYPEHLGHPNV